jgi:hypothetical protein
MLPTVLLTAILALVELDPVDAAAVRPRMTAFPRSRAHSRRADTTRQSGDYQKYNAGLGDIYAPSVTTNGQYWYSSSQQYNAISDALQGSCYWQANKCQEKANSQGNKPFAVSDCNGAQLQACLSQASAAGASYTTSAAAYSSSVASANYAAATQARAGGGDLQSFTGALGGIVAPAVTGE